PPTTRLTPFPYTTLFRSFQKILKHHDEWKVYGYSTREQVESVISKAYLPQVFSEQTSIELIAAMADELMSLVNVYGLSELENPSDRKSTRLNSSHVKTSY